MVLYWSCERSVCSSSRPAGHVEHLERGATVMSALPARRSGRRGCRAAGAAARSRRAGRPSRRRSRSRARRGRCGGGSRRSPSRKSAHGTGESAPRVASASEQTMSTSERRCADGGSRRTARGVHRRHRVLDGDPLGAAAGAGPSRCGRGSGRISASPPVTTCERLSLVETCTVSAALRIARLGDLGVGGGGDEVAAHARRTPGPCRRAGPGWSRRCRSRARAAGRSRTRRGGRRGSGPARAPRCPWCGRPGRWSGRAPGRRPAPGLPMLPCSRTTLTISLMVATELWCWVRPIAQQMIVRRRVARTSGPPR